MCFVDPNSTFSLVSPSSVISAVKIRTREVRMQMQTHIRDAKMNIVEKSLEQFPNTRVIIRRLKRIMSINPVSALSLCVAVVFLLCIGIIWDGFPIPPHLISPDVTLTESQYIVNKPPHYISDDSQTRSRTESGRNSRRTRVRTTTSHPISDDAQTARSQSRAEQPHHADEPSTRISEREYASNLLFGNTTCNLSDYFLKYGELHNQSMEEYIPLRMDYLQRSRVVLGDTTHLRQLLYRIIVEKQCITAVAIGGSVTAGHGDGVGKTGRWTNHFSHWLNHHPLTKKCNGNEHRVINVAKGGMGTVAHYWRLPKYFGTDNWVSAQCSDIDLVMLETATNDDFAAEPVEQYFEIMIRNLLQCQGRVPVILALHSVRSQVIVMQTDKRKKLFTAGDLRTMALLNYYEIPTVSLSNIIYPLSYRYHMNYHKNETLAEYKRLRMLYDDDGGQSKRTGLVGNSSFIKDYDDDRYSYFATRGLRVDNIHPTLAGQKWLAVLIGYQFIFEWNNMQFHLNKFSDTNYDKLFYQNKVWLSPNIDSLPPFLTIDIEVDTLYAFLANHRTAPLAALHFDVTSGKTKVTLDDSLVIHNGGPERESKWQLIVENKKKQGLLCEDIGCYIILNLTNPMNADTIRREQDGRRTMVVVSYLVSYENMGRACIWIDDRYDTSKCNEKEDVEYHIIDALISEPFSVTRTALWHVDLSLNSVYFHALILDSNRTVSGHSESNVTERHKFKLIDVQLLQAK